MGGAHVSRQLIDHEQVINLQGDGLGLVGGRFIIRDRRDRSREPKNESFGKVE